MACVHKKTFNHRVDLIQNYNELNHRRFLVHQVKRPNVLSVFLSFSKLSICVYWTVHWPSSVSRHSNIYQWNFLGSKSSMITFLFYFYEPLAHFFSLNSTFTSFWSNIPFMSFDYFVSRISPIESITPFKTADFPSAACAWN